MENVDGCLLVLGKLRLFDIIKYILISRKFKISMLYNFNQLNKYML